MPTAPEVPISKVAAAKAAADRMRAQWRIGLTTGRATLAQLFGAACHPDGSPLLRLRLLDVFECLPGLGQAGARRALGHVRRCAGVDAGVPDRDLTVSWVVDPRAAKGARMTAVADGLCLARGQRTALVEPTGWPFSPIGGV